MGASISQLLYDLNVFDGNSWANFFLGLWARIGRIFYTLIIVALGRVADICQLVFKKLAGISPSGVSFGDGKAVFYSLCQPFITLLILVSFHPFIKTLIRESRKHQSRNCHVVGQILGGIVAVAYRPLILVDT